MVGSRAEKAQSSSVGKNCVTMGFCNREPQSAAGGCSWRPAAEPYVEVLHRLRDVELVHGGDDDGGGGEEEEQEEEDAVDDEAADPPGDPAQRQVLPAGRNRDTSAEATGALVGVCGRSCGRSLWTYQRTFCGSGAYETLQL